MKINIDVGGFSENKQSVDFEQYRLLGTFDFSKILISIILILSGFSIQAQCSFKPIGHRGGSSYHYPENTLVSLEQGFIEDIYAAEVDVRFTADNALVLMHDSYIDRTTNGIGDVENLTLDYLRTLDAGSWKDPKYAGTPVPTLKEALLLANQYHKKLYLNMKVFAPELIASTLKEAGVADDIILLDPDDFTKVATYHEILPNTPLVYFGALPEVIDDPVFYTFLKDNGVIAIEIPADYIYNSDNNRFEQLRDVAHSYQLELWAYTVNDPAYFMFLKEFGIDALETDRPSEAYQVFCNNSSGGYFPEKRITAQWDFNQNLFGTIGSKLVLMGDNSVANQQIEFGTTQSFNLSSIENNTVNIARIPAFDSEHALRFFSNIAPEGIPGGLDCDNTYSLIFDILKPAGENQYTSILQTSNNNSDDADFFLLGENNSFGIQEQYNGSFADSTWVRLALVFDLYKDKLDEYLDGKYVGTILLTDSKNGRFCLNNNWGVQSSNLFSDNDGETNPVFVSSIQVRNYAMSPDEIEWLGKPTATKIDQSILNGSTLLCPEFESDITSSQDENTYSLHIWAGDTVNYKWEMNTGNGWERITGNAFLNSASSTLKILNTSDLSNNLKFRCIAYNDCQSISNEFLFEDLQTGLKFPVRDQNVYRIYPNPSSGLVTVDLTEIAQPVDVKVFTIQGIQVFQKSSVYGKIQLKLDKGTYFIQVLNQSKTEVKKLMIID
ncbi:MAG TPA: glycerophosphodiester phosphodiesterase family protein [Prolixibacteraceae bacterium]|nr:glycerophosphodiester phosphodiesterase family protein [Prolixibacteraceae bacterium]